MFCGIFWKEKQIKKEHNRKNTNGTPETALYRGYAQLTFCYQKSISTCVSEASSSPGCLIEASSI